MDSKTIENIAIIIKEASKSPLGFFCLLWISLCIIALYFFRREPVWVKLAVFFFLFVGMSGFVWVMISTSPKTPEPPVAITDPGDSTNRIEPCTIEITSPQNNSVVSCNNEKSEEESFTFTVEGKVTDLGENSICIYQKVSPDSQLWWRSGNPITQENLGQNGTWSTSYASCGTKDAPHASCLLKAVVQKECPKSGMTTPTIGETLCSTAVYTFKTKP
ncbi:hypothetical protein GCAAIG_05485 [Candidatus Electronema halotolerans]